MIQRILNILFFPGRMVTKGFHAIITFIIGLFRTIVQKISDGFMSIGRTIKAAFWGVCHSPMNSYRAMIRKRDWLLAKVQYLNDESA